MALNDTPDPGPETRTSGPRMNVDTQGRPVDASGNTAGPPAQYDKDGYPIPQTSWDYTGRRSDGWNLNAPTGVATNHQENEYWNKANQDARAYDPNMADPMGEGANPYDPQMEKSQWQDWNRAEKIRVNNKMRKDRYRSENESKRRAPVVDPNAASGPSTPFQSSGVDLTKQGKGENYIDSILSHYEKEGAPQTTNYSESALAEFQQKQPQDMSAYYDTASRKAQNAINTQMAARGSYGSSNAVGNLMAAETDIRAQEARDNASYGLQRFGTYNTLAGAADSQNNNRSANQLLWAKGLGDLASQNQGLGEERNQQLWSNNLALAGMKAGAYSSGANAAIDDVTAANDAANNATMGVANDAQSNAAGNANRSAATTTGIISNGVNAAANGYNYVNKPGKS